MRLSIIFFTFSIISAISYAHEGDHSHNSKIENTKESLPYTHDVFTGEANHRYRFDLEWQQNVEKSFEGPTHGGVAVDSVGNIYICTDSEKGIFVYSESGELIKTLGPATRYLHAITIEKDGNQEIILGANPNQHVVQKISLNGEVLLSIPNDNTGEIEGTLQKVTGCCLLPDGRIVASCGYGSDKVHMFDAEGRLLFTIGGHGESEGKFICAHGVAYDDRYETPRLLFANRERGRLEHYSLEGEYLGLYTSDVSRPCVPTFNGDTCYVAELNGRVSVFDQEGKLLTRLGENQRKDQQANFKLEKADWSPGIFSAPHGLGFAANGSLYVQDWNKWGRVSRLVPVSE